jgi:intracellular sulfur oxidation DsrE/DsrF family protein
MHPDGEGYIPIPAPTFGDTVSAAFRQNNTVASFLSQKDIGTDNHDDGVYDYKQYVKDNGLQGYEDTFAGILNSKYANAMRDQIHMEQADKQTLEASGHTGTVAAIAAGFFDLPTLIPGTVAVRGAKGGYSVARSMLAAGVSAMATQAGTELALHGSQQTRTGEDSMVNVGAAAVLGSLLGGGVAAVLGKSERTTALKAMDNAADIISGKVPNTLASEAGAGGSLSAARPGSEFVLPPLEDMPKTREDLSVSGAAASAVVKATSWFNPVLRSTQRYSASARQLGSTIFESTVYRAMHREGMTTGVSVEAAARTQVSAMTQAAYGEAQNAYKALRQSGARMKAADFYDEVGKAMRNNDEHPNEFVTRAARGYRNMFDHFTKQALDMGLLDEKDLDVKTAASYFSRVYDRDALIGTEGKFHEVLGKHFSDRMIEAHTEDLAKLQATRAQHAQLLDDLQQAGPARASRIDDVYRQGKALDQQYADLNDIIDQRIEGRAKIRAGDETGRQLVKDAVDRGGERLQQYLADQTQLRRRMRALDEHNPDAQLAIGDKIRQRIDDMHEITERSIASTLRTGKNLLNGIDRKPMAQMEQLVSELKTKAMVAQDKLDRTEGHIIKLQQQGVNDEAINKTLERMKVQRQSLADAVDAFELHREAGPAFAAARVQKLEKALADLKESQAARDLRRGEQLGKLKERAAKLTPEEVKARAEARMAKHNDSIGVANTKFGDRWKLLGAKDEEAPTAADFANAGRNTSQEIFGKITGREMQQEDLPAFITKITQGPLKDRTFMVPDELLAGNGWLKNDVRLVGQRYARLMAGEIELTRRFGNATMKDQLDAVSKEYVNLSTAVHNAQSVQEIESLLGRKIGSKDVEAAKVKAAIAIKSDMQGALEDLKAGRDMIRGSYKSQENMTNFASITRSLMSFNYLRQMGGVLLANMTEFYRPAMVHGVGLYLQHLPSLMAEAFGKGSNGIKLAIEEARKSGLVGERITHSMMQSNGDVLDPFIGKTTQIERFMHKGTEVASRWNLINAFTDAQQAMAATLSQHRILEAILGNKGEGTFLHTPGEDLLRMLGVDARTQADMAVLYAAHGREVDGVKVPMTDDWTRDASMLKPRDGVSNIERADKAVRTFRAALNTDVNSIVARRGLGDGPLFINHPVGKLLTQFSGYMMGAHSRVMIRGLQESQSRMIGGLVALTAMGALTSYLAQWRNGRERFDKYVSETTKNPALLIGEGLDRSGFFPMLFDMSNRAERLSGAVGYNYRVNPIKSSIALLGGGTGAVGMTSSKASDSAGAFGALLGPTAGLVDSGIAAARVGADTLTGQKVTKHDANTALAGMPTQSYYGMRELLQLLSGNSPYVREQ